MQLFILPITNSDQMPDLNLSWIYVIQIEQLESNKLRSVIIFNAGIDESMNRMFCLSLGAILNIDAARLLCASSTFTVLLVVSATS